MAVPGRLAASTGIPAAPSDLLEDHITINSSPFTTATSAFQSADDKSACLGWRNSRETWN